MPEERTIRSDKLADGYDPVELGGQLRHELETNWGYVERSRSTWLNPARVKVTMGYAGREYRLRFYRPGQVTGPPVEVVTMGRVDQIGRAREALRRWNERHGAAGAA